MLFLLHWFGLVPRKNRQKVATVQLPEDQQPTYPLLDPQTPHQCDWAPESRENNWRETCRLCGTQARGSCQ